MNYIAIVRLLSLIAIVWFIVLAVKRRIQSFTTCSGAMLVILPFPCEAITIFRKI